MAIRIKHTNPSLNEFATDDLIVNINEGALFFKSNTELFRVQGDNILTTGSLESGIFYEGMDLFPPTIKREKQSANSITHKTYWIDNEDIKADVHIGAQVELSSTNPVYPRLAIQPPGHTGGPFVAYARDDASAAYLEWYYGDTTGNHIMTFKHTGKVGIGKVTNPGYSLTVSGSTSDANGGVFALQTSGSNLRMGGSAEGVGYSWIQSHLSQPLLINPLGASGNNPVAIGTTNVTQNGAPLHVEVDDDTDNNLKEILHLERHCDDLSSQRQAEGGYIGLYVDDDNNSEGELARISWRADNANNFEGDGRLGFWTAKSTGGSQAGMALTEKMTLTRDGYLGLADRTGDQEPTAVIHMSGSTFGSSAADGAHYTWMTFGKSAFIKNITYQSGLFIRCDSSMILHAGDGSNTGSMGVGNGYMTTTETLWLTADGVVKVKTGMQNTAYTSTFDASGGLTLGSGATVTSDRRLKKDIHILTSSLNTVKQLEGVSYTWLDNRYGDRKEYGLIAQDVEKTIPNFTVENEEGYKTLNYSSIIPFLIESIKEQQQQIDNLKEKLNVK
tara:strand:+ start:382 stop:2058 length:1677 start_codon:yes stop_codon:yes gene_type:complete